MFVTFESGNLCMRGVISDENMVILKLSCVLTVFEVYAPRDVIEAMER